jgi:hypothetical protein
MRVEERLFQVFQGGIVEGELALQGPIREALVVLEPVENLCEDLFEGHSLPPVPGIACRCASSGPILAEPRLGLHAGQHARYDKVWKPANMASGTVPHRVYVPHM